MKRYRLAADIGGTFTDVVLFDKKLGKYTTRKTPTTPDNLSKGVLNGISDMVEELSEIDFFVHGTTVGLNAFLERKGVNTALIVTEGFRDMYEIGRANRPEIYNIQYRQPQPLVKRRHIYEAPERILVDGTVEKELDISTLNKVIEQISKEDYDSVAICLLHAYNNPKHELEIRKTIKKQLPEMSVSLSHEIAREWREYERTSTTIINSYIAPIVEDYLIRFEKTIEERGLEDDLYIMQSNGGVMTSKIAREAPIQTLLSGPVGGTIGSSALSDESDKENLICVDMGGTSFDVSMVIDNEPDITSETSIEKFPILSPMVNIQTIGAGGGSIAWIEAGGLRVGPHSAGANPGPACYGNGGTKATVTDANLVLGRIDADGFLDGDMKLDYDAAYQAIKKLAKELGLSVTETASGICDIANAMMADAIRTLTISKGIDPRDFSLVAYGGAGPMHAILIAENLGIDRVIIPMTAGTFSAWGMLQTDIRQDAVRNYVSLLEKCNLDATNELYKEMKQEVSEILQQQDITQEQSDYVKLADLRYAGQEYTLTINIDAEVIDEKALKKLRDDFDEEHLNVYGHNNPQGAVEIVNLRMIGYGFLERDIDLKAESPDLSTPEPIRMKDVIWEDVAIKTPIYSSHQLVYGQSIDGPSIVETPNSTIVVPQNYAVDIDQLGNLEVTRRKK